MQLKILRKQLHLQQEFNAVDTYPSHIKIHNLCNQDTPIPSTLLQSLGPVHKFCVSCKQNKSNIEHDQDIYLCHYFSNSPDYQTIECKPKLYIESNWEPDPKSDHIKLVLKTFKQEQKNLFKNSGKTPYEINISKEEIQTLKKIKKKKIDCVKY